MMYGFSRADEIRHESYRDRDYKLLKKGNAYIDSAPTDGSIFVVESAWTGERDLAKFEDGKIVSEFGISEITHWRKSKILS